MSDATGPGSSLGPYPIEREIGRGGMGIVYLGRDSRLDRPVAIKVLPDAFATDPERLARFEREARLLASLSHPNIAAIHGLEESGGRRFLVLEYVEGETLAERLARGPLPVDDAVDVCRQIAAALEAAHDSGVIHRDLKPGNVKLTPSGDVKVLDFGLAKSGGGSGSSSDPSLSVSPTLTAYAATGAGVILGTAAYMSPEQARGRALDRRTDIWSFGCVLYECLTGQQAFAGETVSDMIARILQGEPDWKALPANTPPRLRELLERCLTKDARKRLRDIGEARLLLESGDSMQRSGVWAAAAATSASPAAGLRGFRIMAVLAAVFVCATLTLAAMLATRGAPLAPVRRVSILTPPMFAGFSEIALVDIAPDGSAVAISEADSTGATRIWLRVLDTIEGRILPGTAEGIAPFWSPDGRSIAFFTQDKLKKIDLRGGSAEVLCAASSYGRGGTWGTRDVIVFAGGAEGPLSKIAASGGTREPATVLDSAETGHRYPRFLPDGRHFLYASLPPRAGKHTIYIGSIDDPKRRDRLMEATGTPVYAEPGWLLFTVNDRLVAQRFDARTRRLSGDPIALPDEPGRTDYVGAPWAIAGTTGPIAYIQKPPPDARLEWLNAATGARQALPLPPAPILQAAVSPEGRRVAVIRAVSPSENQVWLVDLDRMVQTRLGTGPGRMDRLYWSPDGNRVAYSSDRNGRWDLFVKRLDAAGEGEAVLESGSLLKYASGWTPDGRELLFDQIGPKGGWDMWILPLEGDRTPRPLLATAADEQHGTLSPDGRWLAYDSNESGRFEVYVATFPDLQRRHQISTTGGFNPKWRNDGLAVGYQSPDGGAFVEIDPETGRPRGRPRVAAIPRNVIAGDLEASFQRLLLVLPLSDEPATNTITLLEGWRSALPKR